MKQDEKILMLEKVVRKKIITNGINDKEKTEMENNI